MAQPEGSTTENEFTGVAQNAVGDHATAEDSLGFAPYVEAIAAFLTSNATEPPLTISIEGEWGSGKSSFMLQLERAIAGPSRRAVFFKELPTALGGYTTPGSLTKAITSAWKHKTRSTIRFNAWRHDKQDALWAAFALSVSRRLRQRVGFVRGWWGDFRLFLMRLSGWRGWFELALLAVSIVLLVLSASYLGRQSLGYLFPGGHWSQTHFDALWNTLTGLVTAPADKKDAPSLFELLWKQWAVPGSWGAMLMLSVAGLAKFHKQLKVPISIDLKKYLSTPDYSGHAAFIETFHEDFARLVRAYAGDERIYIFIDDLDRCDVPKAAELMQAINLMISDAGKLVFVLGMDREKVAAGITQKYKELLPFLPEYAGVADLKQAGSGSNLLSFGYSYLEKFIQLSFTLPVIAEQASLDKFLDAMLPKPAPPTSWGQLQYYWRPRVTAWQRKLLGAKVVAGAAPVLHAGFAAAPPLGAASPASAASADAEAVKTERRIRRIRVRIAEDSKGVRSIVSMVSPMFENNPRRLKQFISTYRLALALSSDQGILDVDPESSGVTPQQLGKFVALTMKFPDLRSALAESPELFGELERTALSWPEVVPPDQKHWRWLHKKSVRTVVRYGVRNVSGAEMLYGSTEPPNPYSMIGLNVSRVISLLPKAPPPPPEPVAAAIPPPVMSGFESESPFSGSAPPHAAFSAPPPSPGPIPAPAAAAAGTTRGELFERFNALASEYEQIRFTQRASTSRTEAMTALVRRVQENIAEFSPQAAGQVLADQLNRNGDGNRVVALAIMCERVSAENLPRLLQFLAEFRSPFEHYWAIRALLLHEKLIDRESAVQAYDTLNRLTLDIEKDPGRVKQAQQLKNRVEQILSAPDASSSMA